MTGAINMAKAHIGDIIEFKDGLTGIVEKINENSVIVDLTYMENFNDLGMEEKTVVNHKNYKIIHSANND
ncbi:YkvS family protein [Listeria kieliensis]|nr:YkvS family protein [Listeria kieliensis]